MTFKERARSVGSRVVYRGLGLSWSISINTRAYEGLPDQLTTACFHPPTSRSLLSPLSHPLLPIPRPDPESLMSPLARMQVAKRQLSSRELRTSCFDYPPAFLPPPAAPRRVMPFLGGNETAGNATRHLRPPPPFNLEKFQRVRISDALERTD